MVSTSPATSERWGREATPLISSKGAGAEIEVVETGTCCGMAGTFGLKKGFLGYALSQAVGRTAF